MAYCDTESKGDNWICEGISSTRLNVGLDTKCSEANVTIASQFRPNLSPLPSPSPSPSPPINKTEQNSYSDEGFVNQITTKQKCREGNTRIMNHGFWETSTVLDVVSEETPWENISEMKDFHDDDDDDDDDCFCSSSASSSTKVSGEICITSGGEEEEEEIQSFHRRRGGLDTLASLQEALPCKKSLSQFFSGKSRSFSCLADVSIEDIAKPENPYAKRRKLDNLSSDTYSSKSRFHTMQGVAAPSTKTLCSAVVGSKYTMCLDTTTLINGKKDAPPLQRSCHNMVSKRKRNPAPMRSYSLSDLQRQDSKPIMFPLKLK